MSELYPTINCSHCNGPREHRYLGTDRGTLRATYACVTCRLLQHVMVPPREEPADPVAMAAYRKLIALGLTREEAEVLLPSPTAADVRELMQAAVQASRAPTATMRDPRTNEKLIAVGLTREDAVMLLDPWPEELRRKLQYVLDAPADGGEGNRDSNNQRCR